jgi:lysophosphatidate acyltransferase
MILFSLVRALLAWGFTAVVWSGITLLQVISFKHVPESILAIWSRRWARATLRLLGIRLQVLQGGQIPERGARVIVSNHQSALDALVGAALCPPGVRVVAKKEIIWIPFVNIAWWALDFIRIDRGQSAKAIESLKRAATRLKKNQQTLWVLPEGTRSPAGQVGPFKKGAFHIAIEAQVPVLPLVIVGAGELLSKKGFLPRPGAIQVLYLPEHSTLGLTSSDVSGLTESVRTAILQAYQTVRARVD